MSGDGGVVKTWTSGAKGPLLLDEDGAVAALSYTALCDGTIIAESDLSYTVGDDEVIRGLDVAVRSMSVGEAADFEIRADYAYGDGIPPVVGPNATIDLELQVNEYKGNVLTSMTFAQDKPLTPRTAREIKEEYERRVRAKRKAEALREAEEFEDIFTPFKKVIAKFRSFYFFGFFEGQTGETPPWFLRPLITFPAIFAGVGLAFYFLFENDIILLKGTNPVIPGDSVFEL